jgi:hypothetical protein
VPFEVMQGLQSGVVHWFQEPVYLRSCRSFPSGSYLVNRVTWVSAPASTVNVPGHMTSSIE